MPSISSRLDIYSAALGNYIAEKPRKKSLDRPTAASTTIQALSGLFETQRTRMSVAEVRAGDRSFTRASVKLLANVGDALQEVAGTAISAGAIGYVTSKLTDDTKDSQSHIAQAATASLTAATTMLVKSSVGTMVHGSKLDDIAAQQETYKNLVKMSPEGFLAKYPDDIRTEVSRLDRSVEDATKAGVGDVAFYKQKIRHREMVLLARPMASIDLTHRANPLEMRAIQNRLKELRDSYPRKNHATIETLGQRVMANSVAENPTRVQAYLCGPGGVGKTYFVEQFAAALGGPLVHVRVPEGGRFEGGLSGLLGSRWPADEYPSTEPDNKMIGELPMKMIEAGYANPIVFIDELRLTPDNVNELKMLLDPAKRTLKIGGYRSYLDWSRCTVLIGSNDPLNDEALQTRMPQIVFDRASDETKRKVALRQIHSDTKNYVGVLSHAEHQRLVSICQSKIDELLSIDNATFPGTRFLESSSANLVHYVASGLLANSPKTNDEVSEYMKIQYLHAKASAFTD